MTSILRTTQGITADDLRHALDDEDWRQADFFTAELLRQGVGAAAYSGDRPQSRWLSAPALATLPAQPLQAIDQLWHRASGGHFGLSTQMQIYQDLCATEDLDPTLGNWRDPHPFFREVGWLMLSARPFGFLKFYGSLRFDLGAPRGHLPALWYWRVPWFTSLQMGGFLIGQGAGYADVARLDAMVLRLDRCRRGGS